MKYLNINNTVILASLLATLSFTAQAESQRTAEYIACMGSVDYGAFKNSQWQECAQAELARQDVVLNTEYKKLRASVLAYQVSRKTCYCKDKELG